VRGIGHKAVGFTVNPSFCATSASLLSKVRKCTFTGSSWVATRAAATEVFLIQRSISEFSAQCTHHLYLGEAPNEHFLIGGEEFKTILTLPLFDNQGNHSRGIPEDHLPVFLSSSRASRTDPRALFFREGRLRRDNSSVESGSLFEGG